MTYNYNNSNRAFEDITANLLVQPTPYEAQPVPQGGKKTLTPKGRKAVVAVALVAGAMGVTAWQVNQNGQDEDDLRTQQVALERQQTELELAKARSTSTRVAEEKRAERFSECIKQGKDKVGEFGQSRMDDLIDKCNAAFPPVTDVNTTEVASATSSEDSNLSGWAVLGGGLVIGLWVAGKKVAKTVGDNA